MNKPSMYASFIFIVTFFAYPLTLQAAEMKQTHAQEERLNHDLINAMSSEHINSHDIKELLIRGANPNIKTTILMRGPDGEIVEDTVPLIMQAIYDLKLAIVRLLLQKAADVNAMDDRNTSILLRTIAYFEDLNDDRDKATLEDILDLLLTHPDIHINAQDNEGNTAYHTAIALDQHTHAQKLLNASARPNKRLW